MQLRSLNVGQPCEVVWNNKIVQTSIFKTPVSDRRRVAFLNIEGDAQADLRVHGGVDKAVYAYDQSYYDRWKTVLDRSEWLPGLFGENLTTQGLTDDVVKIGDVFQIGTAILQAIQPRFPCFKLNVRFGRADMIQQFYQQRMHGIYFRVLTEGEVQAGDAITLLEPSLYAVRIQDVTDCFVTKGADAQKLAEILAIPYLPAPLQQVFQRFQT